MSNEKPNDDPRQRTDWGSTKQTDEPWKGPPERSKSPQTRKSIWKSGTIPTRIEHGVEQTYPPHREAYCRGYAALSKG